VLDGPGRAFPGLGDHLVELALLRLEIHEVQIVRRHDVFARGADRHLNERAGAWVIRIEQAVDRVNLSVEPCVRDRDISEARVSKVRVAGTVDVDEYSIRR
jgi:hypothetical protein